MLPILGDILTEVGSIAGKFIVDKDKQVQFSFELEKALMASQDAIEQRTHDELMAQIDVNKTEASSASLFVAGWRPFIGWVSGFGVAWTFIVGPIAEWISRLFGWMGTMPQLDTGQLMVLITSMLGLSISRTFERVKGVGRDSLDSPEPVGSRVTDPNTPVLGQNAPAVIAEIKPVKKWKL